MDYSVIIRTIGKAGAKYKKLLESIENSNIQPKEVIVVIPEGYDLPPDTLGYERFIYCKKGMVNQRIVGINSCNSSYALVLDDDIAFNPDFVEMVSKPVVSGKYAISAGPLLEFFPPSGIRSFVPMISGSAVPTVFHKSRYNTVLKTTGYSYNRNIQMGKGKTYETQSAAWTCFFADIEKLKNIRFDEELWLDMHGYSTHDDTAMFYKAWLYGYKSVIVADATYEHLDAGTSKINNCRERAFASGFNTYVFWYRFMYERLKGINRIWSLFCYNYYKAITRIILSINVLLGKKHLLDMNAYFDGVNKGAEWVNSPEYSKLQKIGEI